MSRIPHGYSPVEIRQGFQQLERRANVLRLGGVDELLVGRGVGVVPVWESVTDAVDHGSLGGLGDDDHTQYHNDARGDARYYTETEHINTSAGAADAGKPIKLDASGLVSSTMLALPDTIANVLSDHDLDAHTALSLLEIIDSNLSLYIATTGNDTTGDGSSGNPWLTIAKAFDYLATRRIAADVYVKIYIANGIYESNSQIIVNHPDGIRIQIRGVNFYYYTISSIESSSGSSGDWSIVLNVNTVANISVGDYTNIRYDTTGGTRPETLCGCWEITNVDAVNTRITVLSTHRHTSAPSGAVTGLGYVPKTILKHLSSNGFYISGTADLGAFYRMIIIGGIGYAGITVGQQGYAWTSSTVGISGFNYGIKVELNGFLACDKTCISNSNDSCINNDYGVARLTNVVMSGSNKKGLRVQGARVDISGVISGNVNYGIFFGFSSIVNSPATKITYNASFGITCQYGSYCQSSTAVVTGNGTDFSPAVNTVGNQNSYIYSP